MIAAQEVRFPAGRLGPTLRWALKGVAGRSDQVDELAQELGSHALLRVDQPVWSAMQDAVEYTATAWGRSGVPAGAASDMPQSSSARKGPGARTQSFEGRSSVIFPSASRADMAGHPKPSGPRR